MHLTDKNIWIGQKNKVTNNAKQIPARDWCWNSHTVQPEAQYQISHVPYLHCCSSLFPCISSGMTCMSWHQTTYYPKCLILHWQHSAHKPSFSCSNEVLVDVTRLKVATLSFIIKQYCSYFWLDTALNTAHYFYFYFSFNLCCFHFPCTTCSFLHMAVHLDKHILYTFHSIFPGYLLWN